MTGTDDREDEIDNAYTEGMRAVYRAQFAEALRGLGRDSPEWSEKHWVGEREAAVAVLRRICDDHGDNDWDDELSLADIIDKHLGRYLDGSIWGQST